MYPTLSKYCNKKYIDDSANYSFNENQSVIDSKNWKPFENLFS